MKLLLLFFPHCSSLSQPPPPVKRYLWKLLLGVPRVVLSVPFPHDSLRFPLAEAFLELKAMEGWGQDATHLLSWSPQASPVCQTDRSECVCVCMCVRARARALMDARAPAWICAWDCAFVGPGTGRAVRTFYLGPALPVLGLPQCLGVWPGPERPSRACLC